MIFTMSNELLVKKHIKLIHQCLKILPSAYTGFQNSRPTVLFFLISSLDLLNRLDSNLVESEKKKFIEWIYDLKIDSSSGNSLGCCGFRGSINSKFKKNSVLNGVPAEEFSEYESCHIAQTYTALCCLLILGDDLLRLNSHTVLNTVKLCQKSDGSFCAFGSQNSESDMRFVFCAVAICYILDDFSYVDVERIKEFIRKSFNYDGGIGQGPTFESHGGSTYCAIASLCMLGHLWDFSVLDQRQIEQLKRWAVMKQAEGFHGRTNKPDDSCYAFWIGATLSMLNAQYLINEESVRKFLMHTQDDVVGGFSKYEDSTSDILHTYFSIAALSLFGEPLLVRVHAPLNISERAHEHLMLIRRKWRSINKSSSIQNMTTGG